ncbi:MAG: 5-formyltetrahydrofolate cyclo-ligase [Armatimonadota bacterium]
MRLTEEQRKRSLRVAALTRRDRLTQRELEEKSAEITRRVMGLREWREATTVLGYYAFDSEVRTKELLERALAEGRRVALPRTNKAEGVLELYFVPCLDGYWLAPGAWQIQEPVPGRCERAMPDQVDLILVPGVAFDASGGRLGYGGGYYDRLLHSLRPDQQQRVIGLAFEDQMVDDVPLSFFDFRVPIIVTNRRLIVNFR